MRICVQRHQEAIAIGIEEHLLVTVERREEQRGVTLTLTISADFAKSTFLPPSLLPTLYLAVGPIMPMKR